VVLLLDARCIFLNLANPNSRGTYNFPVCGPGEILPPIIHLGNWGWAPSLSLGRCWALSHRRTSYYSETYPLRAQHAYSTSPQLPTTGRSIHGGRRAHHIQHFYLRVSVRPATKGLLVLRIYEHYISSFRGRRDLRGLSDTQSSVFGVIFNVLSENTKQS